MALFVKYFVIFLSCIVCFSVSCKHKQSPHRKCAYSIDSLAKQYDISKFTNKKFLEFDDTSIFVFKGIEEKGTVSFVEPRSPQGEAGIYTFDKNSNLIFYGFLSDTNNSISFGILYDTNGNEVSRSRRELANVYLSRLESDSVAVTIFLVSINSIYKNLTLRSTNYRKEFGTLYYSDLFSNLIGKTIHIPFDFKKLEQVLYIEGERYNICSKKKTVFIDTLQVPPL